MAPLFVIERELRVAGGAEAKCAAGELDVARRAGWLGSGSTARRRRIAERLARVVKRFRVHLLVPRGEAREVGVSLATCGEALKQTGQNFLAIGQRVGERRQGKLPARVVRHGGRVVQR